jgi:hypothetical protein
MQYKFCFYQKEQPDAFPFNIVVLIFRYTVGERFGKAVKLLGQKKALCRYWALINIVSDQNNLFNSMPILVLPNKSKANITPLSLSLIVT